jgi:hypothetical protein
MFVGAKIYIFGKKVIYGGGLVLLFLKKILPLPVKIN